jgi:hypothetical protein
MRREELLVLEDALEDRTHLLAARRARISGKNLMTVSGQLLEGVSHGPPPWLLSEGKPPTPGSSRPLDDPACPAYS